MTEEMFNVRQNSCDANKDKLLQIYQYADSILHTRIQSFLLTQTFLIVSYVTILASDLMAGKDYGQPALKVLFLIAISLVGILTTWIQKEKMLSIHKKIDHLRKLMLEDPPHPAFSAYMEGGVGVHQYGFSKTTPNIVIVFWIFSFVITAYLGSELMKSLTRTVCP